MEIKKGSALLVIDIQQEDFKEMMTTICMRLVGTVSATPAEYWMCFGKRNSLSSR